MTANLRSKSLIAIAWGLAAWIGFAAFSEVLGYVFDDLALDWRRGIITSTYLIACLLGMGAALAVLGYLQERFLIIELWSMILFFGGLLVLAWTVLVH
jgi:hypothetical protein